MLKQIQGLHHVTSIASDPQRNNDFFTKALGMRRVKKTVNFDRPDIYHLYYGDGAGSPGSIMTYFPFPNSAKGSPGTGEVGTTAFTIPLGSLGYWEQRLSDFRAPILGKTNLFGKKRLAFQGPDGDYFALEEAERTTVDPWTGNGVPYIAAIGGFHSVSLRLQKQRATIELLKFMGYQRIAKEGSVQRFAIENGNRANLIDLETLPAVAEAQQGAGSVHHVAFAVEDEIAQKEVQTALKDTGYQVTKVLDRDYFKSIYFRSPGGVLFEVATNAPGFSRDEQPDDLGLALKLPKQHEHLRSQLEQSLQPIID